MTLHKKLLYSSIGLVGAGLVGMAPYAQMWSDRQAALAAAPVMVQSQPLKSQTITGKPASLIIESLSIGLPVVDGAYNPADGSWTLSKDKTHFALPTTQPNNEAGNTLIYGHNRQEVFASLEKLQPGATAVITTDNGYRFTYTYTSNEVVVPSNTEIFAYQGAPRLTLQTCTGRWYEQRQFFYFDLTSVDKI